MGSRASADLIQVVRLRQGYYDLLRQLQSLFAGHKFGSGKLLPSRPHFKEALFLAMEETSRALSQRKIDRYASVLAHSLMPEQQVDSSIDLSTLIRDISQLTHEDIRVLGIRRSVYADVMAQRPNFHDPNPYTEKIGEFRHAIVNSKLHPDDFRAVCERLSGLGLAAEVLRNTSRMGLNDFCYRPTRRGMKLLKLLDDTV